MQKMTVLTVRKISNFAIESCIEEAYEKLSLRALGYFVIHVAGNSYGVRTSGATLLACSLDGVRRRILRKGGHRLDAAAEVDALQLAKAFLAITYDELDSDAIFFGMSSREFSALLVSSEIVWAPDGDSAFDDGGHVLQFDIGDQVRLIAFRNAVHRDDVGSSLAEVWIPREKFYGCLDEWQRQFEIDWKAEIAGSRETK